MDDYKLDCEEAGVEPCENCCTGGNCTRGRDHLESLADAYA